MCIGMKHLNVSDDGVTINSTIILDTVHLLEFVQALFWKLGLFLTSGVREERLEPVR
jgi:hypothetical protein